MGFESESFDYRPYIDAVNMTAVKEHVQFLSSLGTRATGYPGNDLAAEYIYNKFIEYGLKNVSYDYFSVVDCKSYGANVTLPDGRIVEIHPLLPNFISPSITPPEGITGKLIYAGTGELREFKGEVNGSIVLMDWDSESNWIQAAQLGAKAVIFLPPKHFAGSLYGMARFTRRIAPTPGPLGKLLWENPIKFLRFYVEENGAEVLMDAWKKGLEVRLVSTQRWMELEGRNVIGFIEGDEMPEGIIALTSYYDSYSVIPTLAPGAQEAIGVSTLLELAKYWAQRARAGDKPPVTLMFIAFGGHHQTLAGAISFAEKNFFFPPEHIERREFGSRVWRVLNLDLSAGSDVVYLTYTGAATWYHNIHKSIKESGAFGYEKVNLEIDLRQYIDDLQNQYPDRYEAYAKIGYVWNEFVTDLREPYVMPTRRFALDHEVFNFIGPMGFSFTTAYDPRPYYWTPFDTINKINWENVQIQLECIYAILLRSIDESLSKYYEHFGRYPVFKFYPGPWNEWAANTWEWSKQQSWIHLYGKVAVYDEERAFWKPLTKSELGNLTTIIYFRGGGPQNRRFFFADENGSFLIYGPITTSGGADSGTYQYSAWVLDPETGNVVYVPDMGPRKYPTPLWLSKAETYQDLGFLTVFKAATLAILDLTYPINLGIPQSEMTGETTPPEVKIYETEKFVPPDYFGIFTERGSPSICLVAFPPETPVIVTASLLGERYPFVSLTNGTSEKPLGWGFKMKAGEQRIL